MDENRENNSVKKIMSPCDVEALKKCLEENKGDYVKCQSYIEAFKSACSLRKPNSSAESEPKLNTGFYDHNPLECVDVKNPNNGRLLRCLEYDVLGELQFLAPVLNSMAP